MDDKRTSYDLSEAEQAIFAFFEQRETPCEEQAVNQLESSVQKEEEGDTTEQLDLDQSSALRGNDAQESIEGLRHVSFSTGASPSSTSDAVCVEEETQQATLEQFVPRLRLQAHDIMAKYLFEESQKVGLITAEPRLSVLTGVALRVSRNIYTIWPPQQSDGALWSNGLGKLNVGASLTVRSPVTEDLVQLLPPEVQRISLGQTDKIQVLHTLAQLSIARKAQGAAFIRSIGCVVVWCDNADNLLFEAERMHKRIIQFLWNVVNGHFDFHDESSSTVNSVAHSNVHGYTQSSSFNPIPDMPSFPTDQTLTTQESDSDLLKDDQQSPSLTEKDVHTSLDNTLEYGLTEHEHRPMMIIAPLFHGLACGLSLFLCLLQTRSALLSALLDGEWIRLAVIGAAPILFCVTMFFCDNIFSIVLMLLGPIRQIHSNTRYYSGQKPDKVHPTELQSLPRITIHMPVYKETLENVLKPSFESIKKAVQVYELQGGTASIVVSEDGMVLVEEEERMARLEYYEENNITWIGRPKHGDSGFIRAGRFKKASNLNFTYEVLERVEEQMRLLHEELQKKAEADLLDLIEKAQYRSAYNEQLQRILTSLHPAACGSGVDRMGELILLVDSDTRIPHDGLLDAAIEMKRSPEVGILQHCSGVMLVSESIFEKCIAYFTTMVNFSISYMVANGDMAPFMGHNAYLRWSAMKEIARIERENDRITSFKIWSEEHVSEDFVMSLDLICKGFITRWATYAQGAYEEGVSLTCSDELNRWQKYAWGVSEIIFNKIHQWPTKSPFSRLLRRFITGPAPLHYKFAALSYCCSYYAIASALPTVIAVTLVDAWIGPDAMVAYLSPFQVWVSVVVVFCCSSVLSHFIRFRAGFDTLASLAWKQVKFFPFTTFFFGGLSYHCSTALLSHLFNVNMTWGATVKDYEAVSFYKEVPSLLKAHWRMFIVCIAVIVGAAICMSEVVPFQWRIAGLYQVFPLFFLYGCHIAYPILLNSNLIRFSF